MSMWKKWIHTLTKVVETNSFHSFSPLSRYAVSYLLLPSLWSLSCVYAAVQRMHFKRQQKRIKSVRIRCISVGNITAGGNGKTPLCEYLAKTVSKHHKVLIVGNGYSKDEQQLLQWKLREHNAVVGSGRNRLQVVEEVQKEHPDLRTVILDDGFQCVSVRRDADLLVLNALNPFSNRCLIPRGTLREPLSSVSRAHLFLLNHANLVSSQQLQFIQDTIHSYKPAAKVFRVKMEPVHLFTISAVSTPIDLKYIDKKRVIAFTGIAQPRSFHLALKSLGAEIVDTKEYPDHHPFSTKELANLQLEVDKKNAVLITTEKDFFRVRSALQTILSPTTLVLSSSLQFMDKEDEFQEELMRLLNKAIL